MKSSLARENIRKLKVNPHQSKDVQSQSPPHKKLLKKIEMIHKEPSHKYDLSLKENLLAREPPEEEVVVDFRVEIERRFKKTVHNQTYKFPRNGPNQDSSDSDSALSSPNSSFESLKHVTIYDLSSQNNKKKKSYQNKHSSRMAVTDDSKGVKASSNYRNSDNARDTSTESGDWDAEEKSGVPLELRIRDKSSATYKKLLALLDKQLNAAHNKPNPDYVPLLQQPKKPQQTDQEQRSKTSYNRPFLQESTNTQSNRINTLEDNQDIEVHKLELQKKKKERNIKSQGRHERTPYNFSEFLRPTKLTSSSGMQGVKKNPSQEKVGTRIETMPAMGSSSLEKTFGNLNASTTKGETKTSVDLNRFAQDSFSKLYSSNILKSTTPQYVKNNIISNNLKENIFRTYTQENYPTSSSKTTIENLYQKAKYEVLNHKLRVTTSTNPARYQVKNSNSSLSTTKREETPKDVARKVNFNNFYGSPDVALDKSSKILGHSSQNNLAKKDSVRAFQMGVTYKKSSDTPIYASYDFSSQPKIAKKPNFKLDLNKRGQASRDTLSSTRNRNKRTPDKFSDVLNTESALRNSYDIHQYSYILNNSSQKNTSKKNIGFVPTSNTAKNLSFSKAFFSYK